MKQPYALCRKAFETPLGTVDAVLSIVVGHARLGGLDLRTVLTDVQPL